MPTKPFVTKSREVLDHIDPTKPVFVYRNLHKKCLSVRQGGIVKCHAENVVLNDCEFKVSLAGQKRVRDEKKKNVHAGIKGMVVSASRANELLDFGYEDVYYNPYKTDWWKLVNSNHYVDRAGWVDIYADSKGANVMALDILYKNDVTPCYQTT